MALFLTLKKERSVVAILIFNVPARTMKRKRFALAGVPLLTSFNKKFLQLNAVASALSELYLSSVSLEGFYFFCTQIFYTYEHFEAKRWGLTTDQMKILSSTFW